MAYSTSVFVYTQRQIVTLLTDSSSRNYMPQYAKPLTIHKGVDNQLTFQFLNQNQAPVDITGKEIICRIINYKGDKVLISKPLTIVYGATGIASLLLSLYDVEKITAQKCFYSLEIPYGEFKFPVFVDQNGNGRGEINIVNSIYPSFMPSEQIKILNERQIIDSLNNQIYYSNIIKTQHQPTNTLQVKYENFTGFVNIEGSTLIDNDWYIISGPHEYTNLTNTVGYTVDGFHSYIRIKFTSNAGIVTDIKYR